MSCGTGGGGAWGGGTNGACSEAGRGAYVGGAGRTNTCTGGTRLALALRNGLWGGVVPQTRPACAWWVGVAGAVTPGCPSPESRVVSVCPVVSLGGIDASWGDGSGVLRLGVSA